MTYYVNGGNPPSQGVGYTGEIFTTAESALILIKDSMLNVASGGWTVKTDDIASSGLLEMDSAGADGTLQYTVSNFPGKEDNRVDLWMKGFIKNVVTGFGQTDEGIQWQSSDGSVYMSTGGKGAQGMRIA